MHYPVRGGVLQSVVGWVRAVDGVTFDLAPRETLGLVGESGCGKSSIGRALLRLTKLTEGTVLLDGEDVGPLEGSGLRAFRRRAQIVFQDPMGSLNPRLTVGAAIDEVLRVHELCGDAPGRRRRAQELLEMVGLEAGHLPRHPHEFSGGERQRVGIARALAVEPDLLVLDEPVSALDVSVQAQVVNLLDDLQRDLGLTYLLIAHDLAVVRHVSDHVAVMYLGRIVESAPAADLYAAPRHPYTRALLSAVPRPDPRAGAARRRVVLPGDVPSAERPPSGCPFHPRCLHPLKDASCSTVRPTLEAVGPRHLVACAMESGASGTVAG